MPNTTIPLHEAIIRLLVAVAATDAKVGKVVFALENDSAVAALDDRACIVASESFVWIVDEVRRGTYSA